MYGQSSANGIARLAIEEEKEILIHEQRGQSWAHRAHFEDGSVRGCSLGHPSTKCLAMSYLANSPPKLDGP